SFYSEIFMIRGIPSDDLTEKTLSLWRVGFLVDTRIMSVRVIFDRKLYREPCQFEWFSPKKLY
ncbi:MAG: hypothetical protein O2918_07820, partial [Bacteroidetes bacterium]|nr:hypothetical protein [Bacteroidota bacterium]